MWEAQIVFLTYLSIFLFCFKSQLQECCSNQVEFVNGFSCHKWLIFVLVGIVQITHNILMRKFEKRLKLCLKFIHADKASEKILPELPLKIIPKSEWVLIPTRQSLQKRSLEEYNENLMRYLTSRSSKESRPHQQASNVWRFTLHLHKVFWIAEIWPLGSCVSHKALLAIEIWNVIFAMHLKTNGIWAK